MENSVKSMFPKELFLNDRGLWRGVSSLVRPLLLTCDRIVVLTAKEDGFVFSFISSEKFGTDCASDLSDLRLPEEVFETLPDGFGTDAAVLEVIEEGMFLLGCTFLAWELREATFPIDCCPLACLSFPRGFCSEKSSSSSPL